MNTIYMPYKCTTSEASYLLRFKAKSSEVWEYIDFIDRSGSKFPEGHGDVAAQGSFEPHRDFKGCPDCQNSGFMVCGHCKKLNCYQPRVKKWYSWKPEISWCKWCGNKAIIKGSIENINGSDDL